MSLKLPDPTLVYDHSFLLGWSRDGHDVHLFVEMLVSKDNPYFEKFDRRKVYGCFLLGTLVFFDCKVDGLPENEHPVQRSPLDSLETYEEFASIDSFEFENSVAKLTTADYVVTFACREAEFRNGLHHWRIV